MRFSILLALLVAAAAAPAFAGEDDYRLVQELSAVASGEGEPYLMHGWDVAIDGELAVACDFGGAVRPARIRTYRRTGAQWQRLADQDLPVPGDSGCRLAFNEGTLLVSSYRSVAPSTGYLAIYRHDGEGWAEEYRASGTSFGFDAVAITDHIGVVGEPLFDGGAGNNQGRIWILRRDGDGDWTETRMPSPIPAANQQYGTAVAIVAGAIVVGAPGARVGSSPVYENAGVAFVLELTIDTWNLAGVLGEPANSGSLTGRRFGSAVAISGADTAVPDRALVSAPSSTANGRPGIVRSFRRGPDGWVPGSFTISMPAPVAGDQFGCSLALDGDWAVIGTCTSGTLAAAAGAVQVARFSGDFSSMLSLTERTDPQGAQEDYLGLRVDISRDGPTLIVGSLGADLYGNVNQGVVLAGRSSTGEAPTLQRAMDVGQGLSQASATHIAADGDLLLLGASNESVGIQTGRGAAYVYRRDAAGLYRLEARLLAPDGQAADAFGFGVALRGEVAMIGAAGRGQSGIEGAGAVYVFRRSGGNWTLEAQLQSEAPSAQATYGLSIGFDGTTALISDRNERVEVYARAGTGVWTRQQTIARHAWPLRLSGDTVALAHSSADLGGSQIGEVAIYRRQAGTWSLETTLVGTQSEQGFGRDIHLDGDRLAVVSNRNATPVLLYRRSGDHWLPETSLLPDDVSADMQCWSAALRGDRLIVGCWRPPTDRRGTAYVFERRGGLWQQVQKLSLADAGASDFFGYAVGWSGAGEALVGAFGRDVDFAAQGAVYVHAGDRLFRSDFD
ncbi:MAG TPA: FG-GAP repeat protein [Dokdonella sp.]|uniref:FG-GAP repeat protein n=1 Tax=Dokdonella sp. TaxID=2291710 RepID=UPI002C92566A|nr:FG-GAP repeat protein [Dokdonella sp.]HUD40540.1 FG-GAP repeat protein [Dokdonella sp.]